MSISGFFFHFQFAWIEEHLGEDWLDKIIITKDKTVVNGHVLIDDRPNIKGIYIMVHYLQ